MAGQHSDPAIRERLVHALRIRDNARAEAEDMGALQRELDMRDVTFTQFRLALGSLANRGEITWKRPSWGSSHVVRLIKDL